MEDAGDVRQRHPLSNGLRRSVDDSYFGDGSRTVLAYLGINMGAVDLASIGRENKVARAATARQPLLLGTACDVDNRDIIADAVGHVERSARLVEDDAEWLSPGGNRTHHCAACNVNH